MARFRSPITGRFVNLAVARRWKYPPIKEKKRAPKPAAEPKRRPPRAPPRAPPVEREPDDFGFDDAGFAEAREADLDFFDDSLGPFNEYDDIDFFSFDEIDEFTDDENDSYEEPN